MESHGRAVQDGGSLAGHQLCAPSRLLILLGLRVMLSKTRAWARLGILRN